MFNLVSAGVEAARRAAGKRKSEGGQGDQGDNCAAGCQ